MVPIGTLCQAENCSMMPQVTQPSEKPQVGLVGVQLLGVRRTLPARSSAVSAMLAFFSASRLTHITMLDELKGNDSMSPFAVE